MSRMKRLQITAVLLSAFLVFLFASLLDLSRFFGMQSFYHAYPNDLIKRINVLLAVVLVWLAGRDSLSRRDHLLMKLVFTAICIGEVFFLLAKPAFAIVAFAVCQFILTFRHSRGLLSALQRASAKQRMQLLLLGFSLAAAIGLSILLFYPFEGYRALALLALFYEILLSLSVWAAAANAILGLFPKVNAKLAAVGMTCFYFCDICVGLDAILYGGTIWLLANSLIWIFYTPAITLLALSCYKQ